MEKITKFAPAFDKRNPDPTKNYGIGAMRCFMVLKGDKGAVHFIFSTGIYQDHVRKETLQKYAGDVEMLDTLTAPMGYDVGYHSYEPTSDYEKENGPRDGCDWLDGKPCYGDGSAMRGDQWMNIFIEEGSDKIWEMLEEYYKEMFEDHVGA